MEFNIIKHIQSLRKNRETDKRISEVIISSDITLVDNQGQKLNEAYDDHGTLTIANNIKKEKGVIIFYESDDSFVAVRVEKVRDVPSPKVKVAESADGSSLGSLET